MKQFSSRKLLFFFLSICRLCTLYAKIKSSCVYKYAVISYRFHVSFELSKSEETPYLKYLIIFAKPDK